VAAAAGRRLRGSVRGWWRQVCGPPQTLSPPIREKGCTHDTSSTSRDCATIWLYRLVSPHPEGERPAPVPLLSSPKKNSLDNCVSSQPDQPSPVALEQQRLRPARPAPSHQQRVRPARPAPSHQQRVRPARPALSHQQRLRPARPAPSYQQRLRPTRPVPPDSHCGGGQGVGVAASAARELTAKKKPTPPPPPRVRGAPRSSDAPVANRNQAQRRGGTGFEGTVRGSVGWGERWSSWTDTLFFGEGCFWGRGEHRRGPLALWVVG
jgi:hypothetical protein